MSTEKLNILLVDDQPAKLLSYEAILGDLGENLIKASSAQQALQLLLKQEIAVLLVDVCMPDLDGFELAAMIREHPRFRKTAIIFISAILQNDDDRLRGYSLGAVDYVPVPIVPEVLRAKVRIFTELYRKTRELEALNYELERRVNERTLELQLSHARLLETEQRRSMALAAGNMGSWEWDVATGKRVWDEGQYRIYGVTPETFTPSMDALAERVHSEDWPKFKGWLDQIAAGIIETYQGEYRIVRPNGDVRWLWGSAGATVSSEQGRRVAGVTIDITERREAEERQLLLAREVDHRARNTLAVVQSILQLTKAPTIGEYKTVVQGRIAALSRVHTLISESRWVGADLRRLVEDELAPFRGTGEERALISGPAVSLKPAMAQSLALVLHELATNAAKYGALSAAQGRLAVSWTKSGAFIGFDWVERGGPPCSSPDFRGFGSTIIGTTIERQLHGSFKFDWDPAGLSFQFRLRVDEPESEEPAPSNYSLPPLEVGTSKLLLVEDEALVALMMRETVAEFGFKIVGPCADVVSARRTIESEEVHAAVLDVNLNGTPVYPVAELLESRGIPFVFVTGYAQETIDPKFAHISVYQKPVDRDALRKGLFAAIGTSEASSRVKKIMTLS